MFLVDSSNDEIFFQSNLFMFFLNNNLHSLPYLFILPKLQAFRNSLDQFQIWKQEDRLGSHKSCKKQILWKQRRGSWSTAFRHLISARQIISCGLFFYDFSVSKIQRGGWIIADDLSANQRPIIDLARNIVKDQSEAAICVLISFPYSSYIVRLLNISWHFWMGN